MVKSRQYFDLLNEIEEHQNLEHKKRFGHSNGKHTLNSETKLKRSE